METLDGLISFYEKDAYKAVIGRKEFCMLFLTKQKNQLEDILESWSDEARKQHKEKFKILKNKLQLMGEEILKAENYFKDESVVG